MKKSEFLQMLYEDVDTFLSQPEVYSKKNLIDFILDRCLRHGMLPPSKEPFFLIKNAAEMDAIVEHIHSHTWTPE